MPRLSPALLSPPGVAGRRPREALTADDVSALFSTVMAIAERLPGVEFTLAERRSRGGLAFPEGPLFVEHVGRVLRRERALFADVPLDGEALLARQARALAFEYLQGALSHLADWVRGLYLEDQAAVVADALGVVKAVMADGQRHFPRADHERRLFALGQAREVLQGRFAPRPKRPTAQALLPDAKRKAARKKAPAAAPVPKAARVRGKKGEGPGEGPPGRRR